jgi:hypothetical protein
MRRRATAEVAILGGIVGASGRNSAADLTLRGSPRNRSPVRVWLGEGCSYLAEAHDHVLEVAKNDATYRRQKYSAEDNHERKYERDFRQGLTVLFPWPEP